MNLRISFAGSPTERCRFIATCFLAAGLFIGPFVGKEPKYQGALVMILLGAVVAVVLGAMGGTWLSVTGIFGDQGFYFGHQGYKYIELGRVWQLLLIAGMIIWLALVLRTIVPALRNEKDSGGLSHMLLYSAIAISLFYMAGLMYGKGSHLSDAEYWRGNQYHADPLPCRAFWRLWVARHLSAAIFSAPYCQSGLPGRMDCLNGASGG